MSKLIQPISFKALFIFTPLLFVSIGCSEALYSQTIPSVKSSSENIDYPEIDTALGEKLQPNEEVIAHQITQVIEKSIREQYTAGNALRDAHPKAHGCVRAEFHVLKNIPAQLAKGIFIPDKTMKHGFVFRMLLMMLLEQILKRRTWNGNKNLRCIRSENFRK